MRDRAYINAIFDAGGDDKDGSAPDTLVLIDSGCVNRELFSDSTGVGLVVEMSAWMDVQARRISMEAGGSNLQTYCFKQEWEFQRQRAAEVK